MAGKHRRGLRALAVIAGILLILAGIFALAVLRGMGIRDDVIREPDLPAVPDGTYVGALAGSRFANQVQVTMADGRITRIELLKPISGGDTAGIGAGVVVAVLAGQTLQIDTVGGASITTKAYLKSIEDALFTRTEP